MDKVVVLIPALDPNSNFVDFIVELKTKFKNIVVVNDGSQEKNQFVFDRISQNDVIVLNHFVNLGKGRALKYGINYILNNIKDCKVIVTADSDGQHSVDDIEKCSNAALKSPYKLILGVRDFNKDNVPKKSSFGNKLTRTIFKLFVGLNITDTQTGLRAFGVENAKTFLSIPGERFEYETNMLITTKERNIKIEEININTIYLNDNSGTHFNPIKDSINIYKIFIKYIFSALSSFVIDILLFTLLYKYLQTIFGNEAILISTIIARIISSLYNYLLNAKVVFNKLANKITLIKYYILVVIQMCVSAIMVYLFKNILDFMDVTIIKVIVDVIIFLVNFYIQREWVFKNKEEKDV